MSDKSDKHGPKLDDEMSRESEGLTRSGGPTHPQPWNDPEPVDTDTGLDPTSTRLDRRGAPPGMTPQDVEERSAVASVLAGVQYPAGPDELADHAAQSGATDVVVSRLSRLPGKSYDGLPDIVRDLGIGHEERRT
ncbi:DUF2795 domain-containing protein [Actinocorallia populi]|uniref:DUF2795 domain-containing protein n=1 Tax=Actinocorallia populi TaxID=2079200 RepID=UPI000D08CF7E|nr:DUF2795 domain-containing protein [Actinocorallia populi]